MALQKLRFRSAEIKHLVLKFCFILKDTWASFADSRSEISSQHGMEKLETDTVFTTATNPAALPEGKTEEEAVAIYDNYDFNYEYNSALSITRYREEVRLSSVHRAG